jgi:hypothetical protein
MHVLPQSDLYTALEDLVFDRKPPFSTVDPVAGSCPTPAIHDRRRGGSKPRSTDRRLDLPRQ